MISCDTNVLFAAFEVGHVHHQRARGFLESVAGDPKFALCELVLIEFYVLLRNPTTSVHPLSAAAAAGLVASLRANPHWDVVDYPGHEAGIMADLWRRASEASFARRRVYDARLALTLRWHGVDVFATGNVRDFQDFGFARVWNPLAEGRA